MTFLVEIALTNEARAACYRLRHQVFVEEQGVPIELEIDEHDESDAIHFLGKLNGEPIAASRLCLFPDYAKIQRLVVLKAVRGEGFGRTMMNCMMEHTKHHALAPSLALDAQTHAIEFYTQLGFRVEGEAFDDAGIQHVRMVRQV